MNQPQCEGLCVDSAEVGVPGYGVAYPHPGCPLHAPGETCPCDNRNCISYTHERDADGNRVDLMRLWAIHVEGPDDIVAMPDRATAEAKAAEVNAIAEMLRNRPTASELDPHLSAAVIEWPGTAVEHTADLATNGTEYSP